METSKLWKTSKPLKAFLRSHEMVFQTYRYSGILHKFNGKHFFSHYTIADVTYEVTWPVHVKGRLMFGWRRRHMKRFWLQWHHAFWLVRNTSWSLARRAGVAPLVNSQDYDDLETEKVADISFLIVNCTWSLKFGCTVPHNQLKYFFSESQPFLPLFSCKILLKKGHRPAPYQRHKSSHHIMTG